MNRGNHKNIFADAGVEWKEYHYFDKQTIGLDFKGMTSDLEAAPDGSVVVLHGTPLELGLTQRVCKHCWRYLCYVLAVRAHRHTAVRIASCRGFD